jgi:hypothetical protein
MRAFFKHGTAVNHSLFQRQGWRYGSLQSWFWMTDLTQDKLLETKPYCHPTCIGQCICTQINVATCLLRWMLHHLSLWMKASFPPVKSHYICYYWPLFPFSTTKKISLVKSQVQIDELLITIVQCSESDIGFWDGADTFVHWLDG